MNKLILLFASFILACNNQSTTTNNKDTTRKDTAITTAHWTNEEELEFMDGCVAGAETNMGKEKAYSYCKCVLKQMQAKYNIYDSTAMNKLQNDTAEIARMAQNCK